MKLLFLDIDGVLNGHERLPGSAYCGIRLDCMARLNRIVRETGCRLVISSAWRYLIVCGGMTVKGFEYLLCTHGLIQPDGIRELVVGHTAKDEGCWDRGRQIRWWLAKEAKSLGVQQWCVVDDDPMTMDLGKDEQWRLVRTNGDVGMTDADAEQVIAILNEAKS